MKPIHFQYTALPLQIELSFDTLLHERGSDFPLFRKEWVARAESVFFEAPDTDVLKVVVRRLFQGDTGIPKLHVKDYQLVCHVSQAVSGEFIVEAVIQALTEAGYEVILAPRPPSQAWTERSYEADRAALDFHRQEVERLTTKLAPEARCHLQEAAGDLRIEHVPWWKQLWRGVSRRDTASR